LTEHVSESLLKRVKVVSTETPDGVVHTEVIGPLGVRLLTLKTWRTPDRVIHCDLSGPFKNAFADKVDAFLAVVNRLKIIAEKDGKNIYNLYNPAMPTPAAMRHLERKLRTMAEKIVFPGTCTLSVTPRCPCRCVHCSADRFVRSDRRELTTEELLSVIEQAIDLGVSNVVFTGGEPLVRDDLPQLIRHVDKTRAHAMIFTSGILLTEKKVAELAEAGLDSMNVSIDADRPEVHDKLRRVPGAFRKAFEGARLAREAGILTGVSTYGCHETVENGALEHLVQMARDEGFHEITIFDCVPTGKFLSRPDVIMGRKDIKRIRALAQKYNADPHPFGVVAQAEANGYDGGGCFVHDLLRRRKSVRLQPHHVRKRDRGAARDDLAAHGRAPGVHPASALVPHAVRPVPGRVHRADYGRRAAACPHRAAARRRHAPGRIGRSGRAAPCGGPGRRGRDGGGRLAPDHGPAASRTWWHGDGVPP